MRSILILILSLLLVGTTGFAQVSGQQTVEIIGEIIDQETGDPMPYVHIINQSSSVGTVSNEQGRFWMKMAPTDTLVFSAIGFESYSFLLKQNVTSRKIEVTIAMNSSTMELEPVKVFAYKDEESLKQAILEMEVSPSDDSKGIELPGFYYGPRRPYKPGALSSPISFIANKFSKRAKELEKVEEARIEDDYRKMIQAKYNENVVMELTGLPEDQVKDFMDFCKIEESFISRSGPYEIALAVSRCMETFNPEK